MVECWKKQGKGGGRTTILPIFYLVDPRDVRHQEGAYEEAFRRHSLKQDQQTIKQWKEALLEVGKMKGWHVAGSDGHGAILEQIFVKVDSLLRTNYTLLTDELVGIDVHVNKVVQLLNLDAASEGNFSSKSRFIITTRDKRDKLHEPGGMSHDHSLQLFSKHAFKMDNPPNEYTALAEKFLKVAAGLPLALKVVGSLLFRTDTNFWRAKLKELKEVPTVEVQQILRISYNELTPNEKQIFLDIACVFIGDYKEVPFYMWSSCDFNPEIGMRTLVNRSLVRIDEEGQFGMHDHLRDLGRAIVNEEDVQNPCKRSRIWSNENALDMLANREVLFVLFL
ncbi:unnamed protein product [Linum tenue]|uniref:TIR domain-containing protein n=1 Tax=Linum tenue TaxID=586396 RepID=A0AAV0JY65_9ROSI|nr:unnamed protein product [Linum tenue]